MYVAGPAEPSKPSAEIRSGGTTVNVTGTVIRRLRGVIRRHAQVAAVSPRRQSGTVDRDRDPGVPTGTLPEVEPLSHVTSDGEVQTPVASVIV